MIDGTGQTDLDRVLELVVAAHRGAKGAITELRDLARGIHPPVLDQGLGIALTTLAARSDVPVELVIDLPERPSAAIETIAYFCAAELLTNVAKHSGARHATLEAGHVPGLLRVRVSDDGSGGARIEARGGLAGLTERIRTVDGRLQLSSPPGGPSVSPVQRPSPAGRNGSPDAVLDRRRLGSSASGPSRNPGRQWPRGGRRRRRRRAPASRGGRAPPRRRRGGRADAAWLYRRGPARRDRHPPRPPQDRGAGVLPVHRDPVCG